MSALPYLHALNIQLIIYDHDEFESLYTPDRIDNEINYFCKDKDVIDIRINEIYRAITENSGTNKVLLQYTVIYKEENAE